jgi:four helix bundle protein
MKTHKDLMAWQKGIHLVTDVYKTTTNFPKEEIYGITNQIRRAAISVPSNVAEGAARSSKKEFCHFLYVSLGSTSELETQFIIAENLKFLKKEDSVNLQDQLTEIRKTILGLISYLKK